MPFVEKHTALLVNFHGCHHQTLYSIFQCKFQICELKASLLVRNMVSTGGCGMSVLAFCESSRLIRGNDCAVALLWWSINFFFYLLELGLFPFTASCRCLITSR
jgi:hypothetical protein